jgi:hypothetical protein
LGGLEYYLSILARVFVGCCIFLEFRALTAGNSKKRSFSPPPLHGGTRGIEEVDAR